MLDRKDETLSSLSREEAALVASLAEAVTLPITLWRHQESARLLVSRRDAWSYAGVVGIGQPDQEPPLEALAKAAAERGAIWLPSSGEPQSAVVAMRLDERSRSIATCRVDAEDAHRVARLLESTAVNQRLEAEHAELQEENDSFAGQLASDLEELTFLRSMVDRLASTRVDEEFAALAADSLPVLNATVRAEALVLYDLPNPRDPYTASILASEGEEVPTHATLQELIRRFGPEATRRTLVRNWGTSDLPPEAAWEREEHVPGVRSLVLAPLSSGDKMFGWIAAINRRPTDGSTLANSWQLDSDEFGSGEGTLLATTASILATHAANIDLFREKERLMVNTVRVLVSAIESKDKYTHGHSERVALYTRRIAEEIGYTETELEDIYLSALLHDVGKIGVPDAVLTKPGRLTDEEFDQIAQHPDEGWSILGDLEQLRYVLPGVLYHHERWDGTGYPDRLSGEAIPRDGRVMAVADAFDAMTSDRPYRKGMPVEKAESIIREGAGTQWDPQCVEAFLTCLEDLRRIKDEYVETPRPTRKPGGVERVDTPQPATV